MSVVLPAIMAWLPESFVASSSATYSFIRNFGYIWRVTIPSRVFNSVFEDNLGTVPDSRLQPELRRSEHTLLRFELSPHVTRSNPPYGARSLQYTCVYLSFLTIGIERGLQLSDQLETEFGEKNLEAQDVEVNQLSENTGAREK
jgi:hypothetical protein